MKHASLLYCGYNCAPQSEYSAILKAILRHLAILSLAISLAGCSLFGKKEVDETKDWSANRLYSSAKTALNGGNYEKAVGFLEKLEARYPFGTFAQQARIDLAFAYYRFDEPDSAIAAADRFIKLYPNSPHVDYLYYLKGLVNFNRGLTFFERFFPGDESQRDAQAQISSFNDFAELVRRYPDSRYAEDATRRMLYLRNVIAKHELNVAQFYMKRKAFVAAASRAQGIVKHYQGTTVVPEALEIMIVAYNELGMVDLAADAQKVYDHNIAQGVIEDIPEDPEGRSWVESIWNKIGLDQ